MTIANSLSLLRSRLGEVLRVEANWTLHGYLFIAEYGGRRDGRDLDEDHLELLIRLLKVDHLRRYGQAEALERHRHRIALLPRQAMSRRALGSLEGIAGRNVKVGLIECENRADTVIRGLGRGALLRWVAGARLRRQVIRLSRRGDMSALDPFSVVASTFSKAPTAAELLDHAILLDVLLSGLDRTRDLRPEMPHLKRLDQARIFHARDITDLGEQIR